MTEYKERVNMQKMILLAEEYRESPKWIHSHSLTSMWYETEETKEDAVKGVMDTQFMDGRIERIVNGTGKKYINSPLIIKVDDKREKEINLRKLFFAENSNLYLKI